MIKFFKRVIISISCVILSLPLISHPVFADETTYPNYKPRPMSDKQVNAYYVSKQDQKSFDYKINEFKAGYVGPDTVERQKLGIDILQNFLNTLKKYKVKAFQTTDGGFNWVREYQYSSYDYTSFSYNSLSSVVPGIPSSFNNPNNNFSRSVLGFNIVGKNIAVDKIYKILMKHARKINANHPVADTSNLYRNIFYPRPYTPIEFDISIYQTDEIKCAFVAIDTMDYYIGNHAGGKTPIVNPGVMHPWKN